MRSPRRNTFPTLDDGAFKGTRVDDLPHGRTSVPFLWNILGRKCEMELVGGLWGGTQDEQGALGVASGWLVSLARTARALEHAAPRPAPRSVSLSNPATVETLASLRNEACDDPSELSLPRTPRLRSLDGIQHLRGLVALSIAEAPLLETIAPLTGMASIIDLYLKNKPGLKNVGPVLATLPQLERLSLARIAGLQLADVLPIDRLPRLRRVSLVDCTGLPEHIRYMYQE